MYAQLRKAGGEWIDVTTFVHPLASGYWLDLEGTTRLIGHEPNVEYDFRLGT